MKTNKLPLICILALTGCKIEQRKLPIDWCIDGIMEIEGYSHIDKYTYIIGEQPKPPMFNYLVTTTQYQEANSSFITIWDCRISFKSICVNYAKSEISDMSLQIVSYDYWAN